MSNSLIFNEYFFKNEKQIFVIFILILKIWSSLPFQIISNNTKLQETPQMRVEIIITNRWWISQVIIVYIYYYPIHKLTMQFINGFVLQETFNKSSTIPELDTC